MKKNLGAVNLLYPMPTVLVTAMVAGKPNVLTVAHVGIMNHGHPSYISVSLGKVHYTNQGIMAQKTFGISFPTEEMVVATDYVGMVSGKKTDKSSVFTYFYGDLKTAPLIGECPVCLECRLYQQVDFPTHDLFIGEIVAAWADEAVLTEGVVDMAKVRPLLFDMPRRKYWRLGAPLADAWNVGKQMKTSSGL